jgi:hypothetical protein
MDFSVFIDNGMSPAQIKEMYEKENNRRFPNRELEVYISQLNERVHFIENQDRDFIDILSSVFSRTSVYRECYKLGLPRLLERYEVIKPVLWDEFTAYLYGYFVGDGCLHVSRSKNGGQMDISSNDKQIMDEFLKRMNLKKLGVCVKKGYDPTYRLLWTSKEWYDFFIGNGLMVGKSKFNFMPKFPPKEFMRHFIRGIQDSDGSISTYQHKGRFEFTWYLLGGELLIDVLREYLMYELNVELSITNSGKLRQTATSSKSTARKLYEYLYNGSTICLERKLNKFKEICCQQF